MKKLILVRHGRADHHLDDWQRTLSAIGREEVQSVSAKILNYKEWLPQYVICSEAVRTKQTFEIFTQFYPSEHFETRYVQTLYHGTIRDVLGSIGETKEEIENLMIVGHNPVLTDLACRLSQDQIPLDTANAVILTSLDAELSWKDVLGKGWKLETVLKPF